MGEVRLVLEVYKPKYKELKGNRIRVSEKSIDILSEYRKATGLPIGVIASKMIEFASEYVEVEEVNE